MEHLNAGRLLMADSLGFHIIFALLGVGLPLCMLAIEYMAIRRKNNALRESARLWSYIAAVLVVVGVLSGSVVALQMFLIWPGILQFGGGAIGFAFMLEGYAFIIEATFLALYVKTWKTVGGYKHWLLGWPVAIGSALSAVLITAVDAWMNHPAGITVAGGKIVESHPWQAVFNSTTFYEATHSILGYYFVATLLFASVYAWVLLRGKRSNWGDARVAKLLAPRFAIAALALLLAIGVFGDLSGKYLAKHEPAKLAGIELIGNTQQNAPLTFGGSLDANGNINGGMQVPGMLSWLAGGSTSTTIQGLNTVATSDRPPLVIHTLFDIKLVLIAALLIVLLAFAVLYTRKSNKALSAPMLGTLISLPLLAIAVIELGWVMTELGRQPYAVYGYVLTKDAFTTNQGVIALAWLFPTVFAILGVATVAAVHLTVRRFTPAAERSKR